MKKKYTRVVAMVMAVAMVIGTMGLFTGCGGSKIKDAASLAAANQAAQPNVENYHMDMDMNMDVTLTMDGLKDIMGTDSIEMPMDMTMSMDSGKESAHATSNTKMEMMGQSMDQDAEMYIDIKNGVTYTKAEGTDEWVKSETDSSMSDMMNSMADMNEEILKKATFAETDAGYTLTLDAAEMGESVQDLNLFSSYSASGMDLKEFNIESGEIVYTFDKESALLTKIEMKAVDVKAKGDMSGTIVDMHVPITATMEYSQYGEIDPSVYAIPAEVTGEGK